jgi:hypothetical protein
MFEDYDNTCPINGNYVKNWSYLSLGFITYVILIKYWSKYIVDEIDEFDPEENNGVLCI